MCVFLCCAEVKENTDYQQCSDNLWCDLIVFLSLVVMSLSSSYCSASHRLVVQHAQCGSFSEITADLIFMLMRIGRGSKIASEAIKSFWEEATAELVCSLGGDSGDSK